MFVAIADGEVIGCAGLLPDPDQPGRAEHALIAVRRDWRRRGVATALKRTTLAWAAAKGFTEVCTWTPARQRRYVRPEHAPRLHHTLREHQDAGDAAAGLLTSPR
jgi:GNAT superfamily N-acetyltransferase